MEYVEYLSEFRDFVLFYKFNRRVAAYRNGMNDGIGSVIRLMTLISA